MPVQKPVRHVTHCRLFEHGRYLVLDIQADGFLHHMVRNMSDAYSKLVKVCMK